MLRMSENNANKKLINLLSILAKKRQFGKEEMWLKTGILF